MKNASWIVCIDLESVLIPELWPILGNRLGEPELLLTTREVADKAALNRRRLRAIKKRGVTTRQIEKIMSRVKPLPGAAAFFRSLRRQAPTVVVSDCFLQMAEPVLSKLGVDVIVAHPWKAKNGRITALSLRKTLVQNGDSKAPVAKSFQQMGFKVLAIGDSLNDLGMLRAADAAAWYRPSAQALRRGKFYVCKDYGQLGEYCAKILIR